MVFWVATDFGNCGYRILILDSFCKFPAVNHTDSAILNELHPLKYIKSFGLERCNSI